MRELERDGGSERGRAGEREGGREGERVITAVLKRHCEYTLSVYVYGLPSISSGFQELIRRW